MSNMSYCRFRNTVDDLADCWENWYDPLNTDEEVAAKARMLRICRKIVEEADDEE